MAAASLATAGPIRVLLDEAELRTELSHLSQRLTERDLLAIVPAWCEDGHTGHHARLSPLCGLALATTLGPPLYLPFAHRYLGSPTQPSRDTVLSLLRPLLTNPQLPKAVYGAKETQQALRGLGISLLGILTDPSLCSYLLDAADDHSLAARGFSEPEIDYITCPIGIPGVADKRPQAIAIAVAAQLLLLHKAP